MCWAMTKPLLWIKLILSHSKGWVGLNTYRLWGIIGIVLMSTFLIHGYFLRSRHFAKPRLFSREISTVPWVIIGTVLDGHLDGQYLRFWPKWVINITKLGIQIHTFWHNPRPPRLKNGLVKRPCLNWKGNVCCFGSVLTHEKEIFGESKIRRDMFVHTAPQQHSKGRYLKQGN